MPKRGRLPPAAHQPVDMGPRQVGLRLFQSGHFDQAIYHWTPLAAQDAKVRVALAEAHFRRALRTPPQRMIDLQRALELAPSDLRYRYHLGMELHRSARIAEAAAHYRAVVEGGGPRGAALLLAVATLETNARADLAALPGSTPEIRAVLAPVQHMLLGRPPFPDAQSQALTPLIRLLNIGSSEAEGVINLWRGLGQVAAQDDAAADTLDDRRSLPSPQLVALRQAYRGVAAARAGQPDLARKLWLKVREGGQFISTLDNNLGALLHAALGALAEAGSYREAADMIVESQYAAYGTPAFQELRVQVLDRAARDAVAEGRWDAAAAYWEVAREAVSTGSNLGSPRPFLHNLALAYEAQEQWEQAAEAWRAMLRTQPRRKAAAKAAEQPAEGAGPSPEQWAWVRRRVIECYKRADRPDEAVTIFRQLVKAEPNDLELRLQLAEALLANEQEQAALNEIERILGIDPQHVEARMRQAAIYSARGYTSHAEQILREARSQHPDRADLRAALVQMLIEHASQNIGYAGDRWAEKQLHEALELDPENPSIHVYLGQAILNQRRIDEARSHIDRALDLAGDQLQIYMQVIRCWVIERDIALARAALARAEVGAVFTPEIYVQLGLNIIKTTAEPLEAFNPFLPPQPTLKAAPKPADTTWTDFAREQFDKAIAARPDNPQLRGSVAMGLLGTHPDLALAYAEEAARLAPDTPQAMLIVGIALAMGERKREAKDQLRKAAGLARKQGQLDVAREADRLRREVDSPYFYATMRMQSMLGIDPNEIDLEDLEDLL